jgi:excinuclease UvrABC nuclease subunit
MQGLKIKYQITNFSGLFEISEQNLPKNKIKGCYFLYDESEKLLYIGRANRCITHRLRSHLFVEFTRIEDLENYDNRLTLEKRKHYKYFAYCEIPADLVEIMEIFLIKKFKPAFNYQFNIGNYSPPNIERTKLEILEQDKINNIYLNL